MSVSKHGVRREVYRWDSTVDCSLFSAGIYGNKYVLLLKEYKKCLVFWENPGVGVMLGDVCIMPKGGLNMGSFYMDSIFWDDVGYSMNFWVAYQDDLGKYFRVLKVSVE